MDNSSYNTKSIWENIPKPILIIMIVIIMASIGVLFFHYKAGLSGLVIWIILIVFSIIWLIELKYKYYINRLTYKVKHDINKHERKLIYYSVILIGTLIMGYEILRRIGESYAIFPLILGRKEYYAIVISTCSLVVALLLSLKLKINKIESGEDFLDALRLHAKDLQKKGSKRNHADLHIYSPNINIGIADIIRKHKEHSPMYYIITECDHVDFTFHCPYYSDGLKDKLSTILSTSTIDAHDSFVLSARTDPMLNFLKGYFKEIHGDPNILTRNSMKDLLEIINFDNVIVQTDDSIKENMVGFGSKYELVLGLYSENKKNKHTGEVDFNGEIVTVPEFIEFVPQIQLKKWEN